MSFSGTVARCKQVFHQQGFNSALVGLLDEGLARRSFAATVSVFPVRFIFRPALFAGCGRFALFSLGLRLEVVSRCVISENFVGVWQHAQANRPRDYESGPALTRWEAESLPRAVSESGGRFGVKRGKYCSDG